MMTSIKMITLIHRNGNEPINNDESMNSYVVYMSIISILQDNEKVAYQQHGMYITIIFWANYYGHSSINKCDVP